MALAAHILSYGPVAVGGGIIGYAIARMRDNVRHADRVMDHAERRFAGWTKDVSPPDPADRPVGPPPRPTPGAERFARNGYGVTEVTMQCIKPSCRRLNDPDVVLIGIGLSGSAYHCRHCKETW